MGRTAAISAGLHLLVLLALIVVIPAPLPPPPPPDDSVEVEFEGTAASAQKSDRTGHIAAPTEADTPADDMPAEKQPTKLPIEKPPPPPPPPPPTPERVETKLLDMAKLPPPPLSERAEAIRPPPPMKVAATKPPPTPMQAPVPPKPPIQEPVEKTKPMDTVRHQPNPTKNATPDTKSLMNTLDKLLADQKQDKPPTHTYNPSRGGAHDAGGQKHGNLTGALSEGQRKTIGDSVRRCYSEDTAAKDYASYYADMEVTVDASGVARDVRLLPAFQARSGSDPAFRAFAERAERAVLDPHCATLPLPPNLLGQAAQKLSFRFRP